METETLDASLDLGKRFFFETSADMEKTYFYRTICPKQTLRPLLSDV